MNLDVTPVGGPPPPSRPPAAPPGGADPFGSRPTVRRRRPIRLVLGVALLAAGAVATGGGIVSAVRDAGALRDDAVARGTVRAGSAEAVRFTVAGASRREYSVFLDFDGETSNSTVQEVTVRDTGCLATLPGGARTRLRGARQGASMVLGKLHSVGHFSTRAGVVRVACAYTSGTRRSERRRPEAIGYLVTPGTPSGLYGSVGMIVGGVSGGLLGGFLAWSGWRGRRVPAHRG